MRIELLCFRDVKYRPSRAILTVLSIALAVAATAAVSIASATARLGYQQIYQASGAERTLEVLAKKGERFEYSRVAETKWPASVLAAEPIFSRPTILRFHGQRVKIVMVGLDPARFDPEHEIDIHSGTNWEAWSTAGGALVDQGLADQLGIHVGDELVVLTSRGVYKPHVSALVTVNASSLARGGTVFLPLATIHEKFPRDGSKIDVVRLRLKENVAAKDLLSQVEALLPEDLTVRQAIAPTQIADEMLRAGEQGLDFAVALSIAMAAFIIVNAFLMNVSERRRQLAIMRCVGATRPQISRLLLTEGMWLAGAGTILGLIGGVIGAQVLSRAMGQMLGAELPQIQLHWRSIAVASLVGPAAMLLAVYIPLRKARNISPGQELGDFAVAEVDKFPWMLTLTALVTWLTAGTAIGAVLAEWLPAEAAIPFGVLMMVAFVMLVPLVVNPLAGLATWLLSGSLPLETRLARYQLLRRRTRTALTVGVMVVAMSNGIGMGNAIINNVADVRAWYRQSMVGDFFLVRSGTDIEREGEFDELEKRLEKLDGVKAVDTIRFVTCRVDSYPAVLIARRFPDALPLPLLTENAPQEEVRARLRAGEVAVATVLAKRTGLKAGDQLTIDAGGRRQNLKIAATVNDYTVGGLSVYLDRDVANKLFDIESLDVFAIQCQPDAADKAEPEVKELAGQFHLLFHSFAELRAQLDRLMNGLVASFWVLLAIGFIVAAFGTANTLTMSVLEQTREIALLRIVGTTGRQVTRIVLVQSMTMAIMGAIIGVIAGISMAYLINLCTEPILGHRVAFTLNVPLVALAAVAILVVAAIAAWPPVRRAVHLNLLEALACE